MTLDIGQSAACLRQFTNLLYSGSSQESAMCNSLGLLAGMPTVSLSEFARPRLDTISFFLLGLLLSAGVVMIVWNSLRKDFSWLPRLSYGKACGIVVLWGLLFVVVLTMISGARELMTPGAWEKQGLTYRVRDDAPPAPPESRGDPLAARREKLAALYQSLLRFADLHEGKYPATKDEAGLTVTEWDVPSLAGTSYIYVPNRESGGPPVPLAFEPEVFDAEQLVLMTDGRIETRRLADLRAAVETAP
jgi:hypothetical protein